MTVTIPLKQIQERVPRDEAGDPNFTSIAQVLEVLDEPQLLKCVNCWIKYLEYHSNSLTKYVRRRAERMKAVRALAKTRYPTTKFEQLTNQQLYELRKEVDEV